MTMPPDPPPRGRSRDSLCVPGTCMPSSSSPLGEGCVPAGSGLRLSFVITNPGHGQSRENTKEDQKAQVICAKDGGGRRGKSYRPNQGEKGSGWDLRKRERLRVSSGRQLLLYGVYFKGGAGEKTSIICCALRMYSQTNDSVSSTNQ